jgi:hypothetical protein
MTLPKNSFKTISIPVPGLPTVVYTTPPNRSSLILTCQAVNTDSGMETLTVNLIKDGTESPLLFDYEIPSKEVLVIFGGSNGKLTIQEGDSLSIFGSSNDIQFTLSLMESRT